MKQLSEKQAIALAESGEWKNWTDEEIVRFQLFQNRLCMNFSRFHTTIEKVLNRPVFSHEFANQDRLQDEYKGLRSAPTFDEIVEMIPEEKRLLIGF